MSNETINYTIPNPEKTQFKVTYCGSWYVKLVEQLEEHLVNKYDSELFEFINNPIEVPDGEPKPYRIELNGDVIYCVNEPVDQESIPIIFKTHRYFGEPDLEQLTKLESKVENMIHVNKIKNDVDVINNLINKIQQR